MKFFGLQRTSLVDYPGKICSVLFTGGCNMRCPYCHNIQLVDCEGLKVISEAKIMSFLESRKTVVDAVCISGGEPTIHKELPAFIEKVKKMGFFVKLDSNGTNPRMLKMLVEKKLVDFVAMDIKGSIAKYTKVSQVSPGLVKNIQESIAYLKEGYVEYEFRTTVVRSMHTKQDIVDIAALAKGAPRLCLQKCRQRYANDIYLQSLHDFTDEEMDDFVDIAKKTVEEVMWR